MSDFDDNEEYEVEHGDEANDAASEYVPPGMDTGGPAGTFGFSKFAAGQASAGSNKSVKFEGVVKSDGLARPSNPVTEVKDEMSDDFNDISTDDIFSEGSDAMPAFGTGGEKRPPTVKMDAAPVSDDSGNVSTPVSPATQNSREFSTEDDGQYADVSGDDTPVVSYGEDDGFAGADGGDEDQDSDGVPDAADEMDTDGAQELIDDKMSMDDAEAENPHASKPRKLNRKFIFAAIVVAFCLVMLLVFIMPAQKRKDERLAENVPKQRALQNYELMAENPDGEVPDDYYRRYVEEQNRDSNGNSRVTVGKDGTRYDENGEVIIPSVVDEKHKPYTQNAEPAPNSVTSTSTGGGGGSRIPDTRNDRLQAKTISGIKGLTPTQQSYSTNYMEQVQKNAASSGPSNNLGLPSREEYLNSVLGAYANAYGAATGANNNAYSMQNDQSGKMNFYNAGDRENAGSGNWLNLNTVWQGTIFEAVLLSAINTDLPGECVARVSKNIYSSQDGRFLLIPQNSMLFGSYNSSVSYAQRRVQVRWDYLIRPDGYRINLGGMNGTDAQGASGVKGWVNDHPGAYLKAVLLMSVFSIANTEFASQIQSNNNPYVQNLLANGQQVVNELGDKLIDRAMNVQPTIKIKEGTVINIVVNENLTLPPVEHFPVTEQYRRQ